MLPPDLLEWQMLQEGMLERMRHSIEEQVTKGEAQTKGLKTLVEAQMRKQCEVDEAMRAHTTVITREVCMWTRRYINAKVVELAELNQLKLPPRPNGKESDAVAVTAKAEVGSPSSDRE